jgi:MSHA biogenesis protein MshJ
MKAFWIKYSARVDVLSLRERVILFLSILAVCMALADVLWLSPAQLAYQQMRQRFAAQDAELLRLRAELQGLAQPADASKSVREGIAADQAKLDAVNQAISAAVPHADSGLAMEQVLVQFLRKHEGLTLVSTGTVNVEMPEITAAGAAIAGVPAGLIKRGMELKVSGPYPELVRYVKQLEVALPTLRWGALELKSDQQPPELTMQVFVVGVRP